MKKLLFILISLYLLSQTLHADTIKMVTVDWPPFYTSSHSNNGFYIKVIQSVLKKLNHDLDVRFTPWGRALKESKTGKFHALLGCWHTKEREKDYYYSKKTLDAGAHFIVLPDSKLNIKKPKDLTGLNIAVMKDYALSQALKDAKKDGTINMIEAYSTKRLYLLLKNKRIDAYVENIHVAKDKFSKDFPDTKFNAKAAGSDFMDGHLYICWSKNKKGTLKLKTSFDKTYQAMLKSGEILKILKAAGIKRYKELLK